MTIWDFNTVDGFNARYMYAVCVFHILLILKPVLNQIHLLMSR
jgi:hypothetical protein